MQEIINAIIHWFEPNDNSDTFSPRRSSQVGAQLPWEQDGDTKENSPVHQTVTPYAVSDRLSWVAHASVKAGVRSCCLFNFPTSHKNGLSTPLFFTPALSLSLSCLKTHFRTYPGGRLLTHIFFVCASPLSSSLTQYNLVILNSTGAQVQPCVCVCEWDSICNSSSSTAVT